MKLINPRNVSNFLEIGKLYKFTHCLKDLRGIYRNVPSKFTLHPSINYDPNVSVVDEKLGSLQDQDIFLVVETKNYYDNSTDFMYCKILKYCNTSEKNIIGWTLLDLDELSLIKE